MWFLAQCRLPPLPFSWYLCSASSSLQYFSRILYRLSAGNSDDKNINTQLSQFFIMYHEITYNNFQFVGNNYSIWRNVFFILQCLLSYDICNTRSLCFFSIIMSVNASRSASLLFHINIQQCSWVWHRNRCWNESFLKWIKKKWIQEIIREMNHAFPRYILYDFLPFSLIPSNCILLFLQIHKFIELIICNLKECVPIFIAVPSSYALYNTRSCFFSPWV